MGKPGENFKVSIESGHPVEWTEEENYLFKLSKFQDDVIRWVEQGYSKLRPISRLTEIIPSLPLQGSHQAKEIRKALVTLS